MDGSMEGNEGQCHLNLSPGYQPLVKTERYSSSEEVNSMQESPGLHEYGYGLEVVSRIKVEPSCTSDREIVDRQQSAYKSLSLQAQSEVKIENELLIKIESIASENMLVLDKSVTDKGAPARSLPSQIQFEDTDLRCESDDCCETGNGLLIKNEPISSAIANSNGDLDIFCSFNTTKSPQQKFTDESNFLPNLPDCRIVLRKLCKEERLKWGCVLNGEDPYDCDLCGYRAGRPSRLKVHMRIHTGEKPEACPVCDYRGRNLGLLKEHLRTHAGDKPHVCDVCGYKALYRSHLQRHARTHMGVKLYACPFCQYQSLLRSHLQRHVRTHTREKPYACDKCDYRSGDSSTLKKHQRTHNCKLPCPT